MRLLLQILLILTVSICVSVAQTTVFPGDGTLYSAIEEAEDGDVLQLIAGGIYTESTNFEFGTLVNKTLTIEIEEASEDLPVVQMLTAPTAESTPVFFEIGDNVSLTLRGIEFNGANGDGLPITATFASLNLGDTPPITIRKIQIEDCYIHDMDVDDGTSGHIISAGSSDYILNVVIDSTMIDNCVFENTGTIVYYKYAPSKFISLTNSTMNGISSYGFRISGSGENQQPLGPYPTVIVDHTTWYNIGHMDGREILLAEKEPALFKNPWTVTNSIFVKQALQTKTMINIKDTQGDSMATITNIAFWDIGNINFRSHTVADTIRMDPLFADAENGDFTLPAGSLLLSYGTRGDAIGDPRWAGNSTAIGDKSDMITNEFNLMQNYPNPFNPVTTISFSLDKPGMTTLKIYDILGKVVSVPVNKNLSAGVHQVSFDASDLNSGVYFYQIRSGANLMTRKMMLVK